jgi:hypothetical protein
MEDLRKDYKLIFNAGCARKMLKMGIPIVDIKADKNNKDKTVFVFKRTPEFEEAFTKINAEIAESKTEVAAE